LEDTKLKLRIKENEVHKACRLTLHAFSYRFLLEYIPCSCYQQENNIKYAIFFYFVAMYYTSAEIEKNLFCELYQFDFFLQIEIRCNLNTSVGYVQFRDFSSTQNQIKWKEYMDFYGQIELSSDLIMRSEHPITTTIIKNHPFLI
jgi:hypothetical protein